MSASKNNIVKTKNDDASTACEDLRFFERRLTEVISHMGPRCIRWRLILLFTALSAVLTSYAWITDPTLRSIPLSESLQNHMIFSFSIPLLLILFTIFGIHRKVVAPSLIARRCRESLSYFSLSCDDTLSGTTDEPLPLGQTQGVNQSVNSSTMMVVDGTGLALVPWDKMAQFIVIGFTWFFKFFIIVGGSIPYVFQYAEIHHTRNAHGFSLFVCLSLCVANILRILFWFGKRFDVALLAQSIVMFICMIFMLEIAVRMNKKHTPKAQRKSILRGNILDGFWAWHDLISFLIALAVFTAFWSIVTAFMIRYVWYVETLGMVSLLVEASLGAPQMIRNFQRKSTKGMSIPMVLAWLCGDLAKTAYFVATGSPKQFWVCAILQITIDIIILVQVFIYRKNTGSPTPSAVDLPYNSAPTHVPD